MDARIVVIFAVLGDTLAMMADKRIPVSYMLLLLFLQERPVCVSQAGGVPHQGSTRVFIALLRA